MRSDNILVRIRRLFALYLICIGLAVHVGLIGLVFFVPGFRYSLEKKLVKIIQVKKPQHTDLNKEITEAFGQWSPMVSPEFENQKILIGQTVYPTLAAASEALKPGDTLELGSGVYKSPLVVKQNGISLIGRGHVVFDGATAQDKGAIVVAGNDFRIRNIECKGIRVPDQNGACIRLEGANLSLDHVYFHDSEQGVLTGAQPGVVLVRNSRFEQLGRSGQAHGIYMGGGELHIEDSLFIASVDEGHEIKSRAKITEIVRSVIASLGSEDSRLIDIPNGGLLSIRDSVLEKGVGSTNQDAIGYGLEGIKYANNFIELKNNIVLMERDGSNMLLHSVIDLSSALFSGNVIISETDPELSGANLWYKTRQEIGLAKYPNLPKIKAD